MDRGGKAGVEGGEVSTYIPHVYLMVSLTMSILTKLHLDTDFMSS